MTRAALAAALLLATACAGSRFASPPPPMRVMTWNIRLDLASDGANAWPHRKEAVAAIVRAEAPDLLGVQEALPNQLADLDALLPEYDRIGVGRDAGGTGEASAILYRRDRLALVEGDTFWLSETPEIEASRGWDAALPRIVTWGRFTDRTTGMTLFHFNTHFDHVGGVARRESASLIRRKIAEIAGTDAPTIVTGDFNAAPGSEPYVIMTAPGDIVLHDALAVSRAPHQGPDSTWNAFQRIEPGRRIDFIFVNERVDVLTHAILPATLPDGRFPSDHFPVVATVRAGERP